MKLSQIAGPVAAFLLLTAVAKATASPVPADTVVQNVNGIQQCIMTYTVPPGFDSGVLQKNPFELDGYEYTFASVNRDENYQEDKKSQTETVTVRTSQQELSAVLAALPSTKEYDNGTYSGTLTLNTSTIRTEAAGYENSSYPISATREFEGLDSNDLSYIPTTTSKDGVTLSLQSVDWQVEGSDLVEDMLVPSSYRAVATYSGTGYRKTPTGYVSTASYTGTVSSRVLQDITYTVTYLGTALPEPEPSTDSGGQEIAVKPETASGNETEDSSGVAAVIENGPPADDSGEYEDTLGSSDESSDKAAAELLADKSNVGDVPQETQEEEESLSNILYIILGIITVILIIGLFAWLYSRWQKRHAVTVGEDENHYNDGYPPDTYMDSSEGQYPGEYPDEGAYGYPQGSFDSAGNPYAMADPYTGVDPYPDGGVSPEGIPYFGPIPHDGRDFYPQESDTQPESIAQSEGEPQYTDHNGYPEEENSPDYAEQQNGVKLENQGSEENPTRFQPENGYIHEE